MVVLLKNESSLITIREVEVVFFYNKNSIAKQKDGGSGEVLHTDTHILTYIHTYIESIFN